MLMGSALRKPWQCDLSAASDENLHYSLPATWEVAFEHQDEMIREQGTPVPCPLLYGD